MKMGLILSLLGLGVFLYRLQPWRKPGVLAVRASDARVSVIIPCRNEEHNIGILLESLKSETTAISEIIVVDDGSTDRTVEVVRNYPQVRLIEAPAKPARWMGKSWACWQGAQIASSDLLLFTDADTLHRPGSVEKAVGFLESSSADLISAPPIHRLLLAFEKILGLFYLLPLIATAYREPGRPGRVYAIGQYLLARKQAYFEVGGHEKIRESLADDIDLAQEFLASGKIYQVYPETGLYEVQMYAGARPFLQGWKRLLRVGMKRTHVRSFVETVFVFHLFFNVSWVFVLGVLGLMWEQSRHGRFAWWGALLAPLSVLLFIVLSLTALAERAFGKKVVWHGRVYGDT